MKKENKIITKLTLISVLILIFTFIVNISNAQSMYGKSPYGGSTYNGTTARLVTPVARPIGTRVLTVNVYSRVPVVPIPQSRINIINRSNLYGNTNIINYKNNYTENKAQQNFEKFEKDINQRLKDIADEFDKKYLKNNK